MKEEGVVWGNMGLSPLYNVADEVKSIKVQEITVQTLLLAGEYDFIKEAHLREIEDIIPNAELVIIKGSGHLLPTEKSEEINQLILGFINKTLS